MKRHLFSIIKGSNQQKRRVLNNSLSLDEDRSEGDDLSLINVITKGEPSIADQLEKEETTFVTKKRLMSRLSKLEQEVFKMYIQQCPYEEIADELGKIFPNKRFSKKSVDNSLVRVRAKAQGMQIDLEI